MLLEELFLQTLGCAGSSHLGCAVLWPWLGASILQRNRECCPWELLENGRAQLLTSTGWDSLPQEPLWNIFPQSDMFGILRTWAAFFLMEQNNENTWKNPNYAGRDSLIKESCAFRCFPLFPALSHYLTPEKPRLCPIQTPELFLLEITLKALPGPAPDDWVVL